MTKSVAAINATVGINRVAELPDAVDVASQRSLAYSESLCEFVAVPVMPRLEEGK
jgi:hypothetical protein